MMPAGLTLLRSRKVGGLLWEWCVGEWVARKYEDEERELAKKTRRNPYFFYAWIDDKDSLRFLLQDDHSSFTRPFPPPPSVYLSAILPVSAMVTVEEGFSSWLEGGSKLAEG